MKYLVIMLDPTLGLGVYLSDGQNAFFDLRITNTNSPSQHNVKTEKVLLRHEKEKKREYDRGIMNIQDGDFTPLIFSVSGVLGKKCSMFHKHMAEKIAITLTKVMKKLSLLLGENYHLSF